MSVCSQYASVFHQDAEFPSRRCVGFQLPELVANATAKPAKVGCLPDRSLSQKAGTPLGSRPRLPDTPGTNPGTDTPAKRRSAHGASAPDTPQRLAAEPLSEPTDRVIERLRHVAHLTALIIMSLIAGGIELAAMLLVAPVNGDERSPGPVRAGFRECQDVCSPTISRPPGLQPTPTSAWFSVNNRFICVG
jgi:hypothetical protein